MRKLLRTILRILDGSPNIHMASRNRQWGQSMLEMAFITPLLAILIAGASEVGWYTNRWLTLLEVTRVGARSATFLNDGLSAPAWDNNGSIVPAIWTEVLGGAEGDIEYWTAENARQCYDGESYFGFYSNIMCLMLESLEPLELTIDYIDPLDVDPANIEEEEEKFAVHPDNWKVLNDPNNTYNPKTSDPRYDFSKDRDLALADVQDLVGYDDIVISVFAIQNVNNANYAGLEPNNDGSDFRPIYRTFETPPQDIDPISGVYKVTFDLNDSSYTKLDDHYPPGMQNIVIGRYPSNANECNYRGDDNLAKVAILEDEPGFEKDPFDYLDNDDGVVTARNYGNPDNVYQFELADDNGDSLADTKYEAQRGFALTGQHLVDDPVLFCFGSEFSVRDVEELINMPGFIDPDIFNPPDTDTSSPEYLDWLDRLYESQPRRAFFEPQGLTLVEIFWEHKLLLDFPLFRPLQDSFGEGDIVIALWTAFPLPSVAPNITYQLP